MDFRPHIEKFARRFAEVEAALSDPKLFDSPQRAQELESDQPAKAVAEHRVRHIQPRLNRLDQFRNDCIDVGEARLALSMLQMAELPMTALGVLAIASRLSQAPRKLHVTSMISD